MMQLRLVPGILQRYELADIGGFIGWVSRHYHAAQPQEAEGERCPESDCKSLLSGADRAFGPVFNCHGSAPLESAALVSE
jgi:hypothetical protein